MTTLEEELQQLRHAAENRRKTMIQELLNAADTAKTAAECLEMYDKSTTARERIRMQDLTLRFLDHTRVALYRAERDYGAWDGLRQAATWASFRGMAPLVPALPPTTIERIWKKIKIQLGVEDDPAQSPR